VHRIASLVKRWLLGTHQGAVTPEHLESYLNEFVFRFNRRTSRSRGLIFQRVLELGVEHEPVPLRVIVAGKRPRQVPPTPPLTRGHPRASSARRSNAPGDAPTRGTPVKWRAPSGVVTPYYSPRDSM
jgi:hypothetical protein